MKFELNAQNNTIGAISAMLFYTSTSKVEGGYVLCSLCVSVCLFVIKIIKNVSMDFYETCCG